MKVTIQSTSQIAIQFHEDRSMLIFFLSKTARFFLSDFAEFVCVWVEYEINDMESIRNRMKISPMLNANGRNEMVAVVMNRAKL